MVDLTSEVVLLLRSKIQILGSYDDQLYTTHVSPAGLTLHLYVLQQWSFNFLY